MTVVELLVAMTIFVVVVTMAVGSFIALVRLQSQASMMKGVQQNGRIALEQISRLARSAQIVEVGASQIAFQNNGVWLCYKVESSILKRYDNRTCTDPGFSVTSTDVAITNFSFIKKPGIPPYLEINIGLKSSAVVSGTDDPLALNSMIVLEGIK